MDENTEASQTPEVKATERPEEWLPLTTDLGNLEMLAFEGAGVTGVVYTGAMRALNEANLLNNIKKFSGTSSGAIAATGAALGYRDEDLEQVALQQDFRMFCRMNRKWTLRLPKNLRRRGAFSGGELRRWLQNVCAKRIGEPDLSFGDLEEYRQQAEAGNRHFFEEKYHQAMARKEEAQKRARDSDFVYDFEAINSEASIDAMIEIAKSFRSLEVAATELEEDEKAHITEIPAIFNSEESPKTSIANAVRASASYPYVFRQAHLEHKGKERIYTDGAYTNSIPMTSMDKEGQPNPKVLGFVSEYLNQPRQGKDSNYIYQKFKELLAYSIGRDIKKKQGIKGKKSVQIGLEKMDNDEVRFIEAGNARRARPEIASRIIPLDRLGIAGNDFEITEEQKEVLVKSAYETTKLAIQRWQEKQADKGEEPVRGIKPKDKIRPAGERKTDTGFTPGK